MTEIVFFGTPKRVSTFQRRVQSTVRSIKCSYNGNRFFPADSCSRRIANTISVVERFGRKQLCSSGRIPTRWQYSLRRRAIIFSSILSACATSEILLYIPHSVRSFVLWSNVMMAYFHCCGTPPPHPSKY